MALAESAWTWLKAVCTGIGGIQMGDCAEGGFFEGSVADVARIAKSSAVPDPELDALLTASR